MRKLTLMKKFMQNFVGTGIHLVIKEKEGNFKVHTIEIMQKTDETCPVKEISVGDYFIHLVATNRQGNEASIVCNWSDDLLKSLMANYKEVKDAQGSQITMFRDPLSCDANRWLLTWGSDQDVSQVRGQEPKIDPIRYIS
jgi:hypothetical protein